MAGSELPVLNPDVPIASPDRPQPLSDETGQRLYQDVNPGLVQLDTGGSLGSGFLIDAQGHVATDAHVALGGREIHAIDSSGRSYSSSIEKIDQINDLAILKVKGLVGRTPLDLGDSKEVMPNDRIYAFGYPLGYRPAYISPGVLERKTRMQDAIYNVGSGLLPGKFADNEVKIESDGADSFKDNLDFRSRPLLQGKLHLEPGNSGGPVIAQDGEVIGLSDFINKENSSESYYTPIEPLQKLHQSPDKYDIQYKDTRQGYLADYVGLWQQSPQKATGLTALGAAGGTASYLALSRVPRVTAGGSLGIGVFQLANDLNAFKHAGDTQDRIAGATKIAADGVTIAGGALQFNPQLRTIGRLSTAAGLIGHAGAVSIPKHQVLESIVKTDDL